MSNDWIEHNGGPQPVGDDVFVEVITEGKGAVPFVTQARLSVGWRYIVRYRILNQHLIDAARLEGIRLGLWAAEKYNRRAFDLIVDALRNTNPETIAKEAQHD